MNAVRVRLSSAFVGTLLVWSLIAPVTVATPATAAPAFVTASGTRLMLQGEPWHLYGASTYGTSNPGAPGTIPDLITLAQEAGLNTLRIVNMFDERGIDANAPLEEASWERVDQLLDAMADAGLHAILDLSAFRNHLHNRELFVQGTDSIAADGVPPECSSLSGDAQARCAGAIVCLDAPADCTNPYSVDLSGDWDTFLGTIATRVNSASGIVYADDPTIAIVSFAGEPNPPDSGEPLRPGTQELTDFYERVFDQWKTYDPNHLVTSGGLLHIDWEELFGDADGSGIDHEAIWALPNQDVLSIHTYFGSFPATAANDFKTPKVADAAWLHDKPWINEEFGFLQEPVDGQTTYTEQDRADWFQNVYDNDRSPSTGVPAAGVAFWNLGTEVDPASHDVNPDTPATWAVVQQNSPLSPAFLFLDTFPNGLGLSETAEVDTIAENQDFEPVPGVEVRYEVYRDLDLDSDLTGPGEGLVLFATDVTGDGVDDDGDPIADTLGRARLDYTGPATPANDFVLACVDADRDGCATIGTFGFPENDPDDEPLNTGLATIRWRERGVPSSLFVTPFNEFDLPDGGIGRLVATVEDDVPAPVAGVTVRFEVFRDLNDDSIFDQPGEGLVASGTDVTGDDLDDDGDADDQGDGDAVFDYAGPTGTAARDLIAVCLDVDADNECASIDGNGIFVEDPDEPPEFQRVAQKSWVIDAATLVLTPETQTLPVTKLATLVADVRDEADAMLPGKTVLYEVFRDTDRDGLYDHSAGQGVDETGNDLDDDGNATPEADGEATIDYQGPSDEVDDLVVACVDRDDDFGCATLEQDGTVTLDAGDRANDTAIVEWRFVDTDGDTVFDHVDVCPEVVGSVDNFGCPPDTDTSTGPVVLAGIDAEDGGVGGHGPIENYAQLVRSVLAEVGNGETGILVMGGGKSEFDDVTSYWTAIEAEVGRPVTFVNGAAAIAAEDLSGYAMVAIASSESETPSGGLTQAENDALEDRASDIAVFVNSGGGLLGFSQPGLTNPYAYVSGLGDFTQNTGLQYSDITPTAAGLAVGISDVLDLCCWHDQYLTYPDFFEVLATNASTGQAAAIGGNAVVVNDADGDGVLDDVDACPDDPGPASNDGCPLFTLTVELDGNGTGSVVSGEPGIDCPGDCTEDYDGGTPVELTATADPGSTFTGWDDPACPGTDPCIVTIDQARTITATFDLDAIDTFTLTVELDGTGTGTVTSTDPGIDCPGDCSQDYDESTLVELTATADPGSSFIGWDEPSCPGTDPCTVTMDQARTVTATFDLQTQPNEPPVAEDQALSVPEASTTAFDLDVSDPDFDPLTVTITGGPDHGEVTCEGTSCTYSPEVGYTGPDAFTYEVDDGQGGTDTATVSVTVEPCPNLEPAIDDGNIATGQTWIVCSATDASAAVGPSTPVMPPTGPDTGLMTSGSSALATDPLTFASRDNGTTARGAFDVSILRIDLDIPAGANCLAFDLAFQSEEYPEFVNQGFNDAFIAELDASDWSVENSVITAPGNFAFDGDGNAVSVDSAFFDASRVVTATGTQYDGSTQRLRVQTPITPGAHQIFLSIFDAGDGIYDSGAFIDGLVAGTSQDCEAGANEPPSADDEDEGIAEDDPGTAIDVLDGDTDGDGDPLEIVAVSTPAHGTAVFDDGGTASEPSDDTIIYTPEPDYFGPDVFTYTVSDGRGGLATATVQITVTEVNDDPIAQGDAASTDEDEQVVIDVATNDEPGPANEAGQSLTYSVQTGPAHGGVDCTPQGSCTYTPAPGYVGPDSFTYEVCDDGTTNGAPDPRCAQATVSLSVDPVVDTFTLTVELDGTGTGTVTSTDPGIDCPGDCSQDYDEGTLVELTATADPGSSFIGWDEPSCPGTDPCTVTMDQARTVTATFDLQAQPNELSIGDASVTEGNSGTTPMSFTVSLDAAAAGPVTVHVATENGTATAPSDFAALTANVTIPAGQTSTPVTVQVATDLVAEPNETFVVRLSSPSGATIADDAGTGTIVNDDTCTQVGTAGNDTLTGTAGIDVLCGLGGNDTLIGDAGNDTLLGGAGNDLLVPGGGDDTVNGEADTDTVSYTDLAAANPGAFSGVTVNLTNGAAVGHGTDSLAGVENATGSAFADHLVGNATANVLAGASGDDLIEAGAGNDQLLGSSNDDDLRGGDGNDLLQGGAGADRVQGMLGDDDLEGGGGIDVLSYETTNGAGVKVDMDVFTRQNTIGAGQDLLLDVFENLAGSNFNDTLRGNDLGNRIVANDANDKVYGEKGNDSLFGSEGDDKLYGGNGNDDMNGGPGDDMCLQQGGTGQTFFC